MHSKTPKGEEKNNNIRMRARKKTIKEKNERRKK